MARSALLICILLLTITASSAATRAPMPVSAPAPAIGLMQEARGRVSRLNPLFPFGGDIGQCLNAISKVDSCFSKLLATFLRFHVHVSGDCCHAVYKTSNKCLSLFSPYFRNQLKSVCHVDGESASA